MSEHKDEDEDKLEAAFAVWTFGVFYVATALLMVIVGAVALIEFGLGVIAFVQHLVAGDPSAAHAVTTHLLRGIELLFLAPVAFLIVMAVGRYLVELVSDSSKAPQALNTLKDLKTLVIALIIAVIATDLVQKILTPAGLIARDALYEGLVIAILTGYLFISNSVLLRRR